MIEEKPECLVPLPHLSLQLVDRQMAVACPAAPRKPRMTRPMRVRRSVVSLGLAVTTADGADPANAASPSTERHHPPTHRQPRRKYGDGDRAGFPRNAATSKRLRHELDSLPRSEIGVAVRLAGACASSPLVPSQPLARPCAAAFTCWRGSLTLANSPSTSLSKGRLPWLSVCSLVRRGVGVIDRPSLGSGVLSLGYIRFLLAVIVVMAHANATVVPTIGALGAVQVFFVVSGFYMVFTQGCRKWRDATTAICGRRPSGELRFPQASSHRSSRCNLR